ncbi:MAG TPA: hypothetical protein VD794_16560, partial [Flavisolibacter sp.]|nr:hypothetical protein [Flavisolibacter sp.]
MLFHFDRGLEGSYYGLTGLEVFDVSVPTLFLLYVLFALMDRGLAGFVFGLTGLKPGLGCECSCFFIKSFSTFCLDAKSGAKKSRPA